MAHLSLGNSLTLGRGAIDSILQSTQKSKSDSQTPSSTNTRVQLNNLVEFYFPFRSSSKLNIECKHVKKSELTIELTIDLPCTCLAQKVDIEIEDMFSASEDFANVFLLDRVLNVNESQAKGAEAADLQFQESIMIRRIKDIEAHPELESSNVGSNVPTIVQDEYNQEDGIVEELAQGGSMNKQSLKFVCIGSRLKVILRVREGFGFLNGNQNTTQSDINVDESNIANDSIHNNESSYQQTRKSLIQEEIRSISRTMISKNSDETQSKQQQNKISEREAEEIFQRAIMSIVKGIRVHAWPCFRIPPSNALIPLINTSFMFETKGLSAQKKDVDFLVALSLISGRKFIQACEIFKKLQLDLPLQNSNYLAQDKAIQLEILIADSMNQHSQLKEKIHAFMRAVELSQKIKIPQNNLSYNNDDDAHKLLIRLHPQLIKILLQYVDTKVEALKVAVLRSIEFLIDQLGCSLDSYLINILISVIKSYPRSNFQNNHSSSGIIQSIEIPKRFGFFQELSTKGTQNAHSEIKFDRAYENSFLNSIIFDMTNTSTIVIKDAQNFQSSYISSIKNLQNHILESFISLLSSMSSSILHQIFNDIILKTIFLQNTNNPFELQLATDLRIYLLKFLDKIVNICSGDLVLTPQFLNSIIDCMYPTTTQQQTAERKSNYLGSQSLPQAVVQGQENSAIIQAEIFKAKQKANQTISLACQNLWQTFKSRLFINYSNKGLKCLLEWIFNKLVTLAESAEEQKLLTSDQAQKLNLVFDLIEVITQNTSTYTLSSENEQIGHLLSNNRQQPSNNNNLGAVRTGSSLAKINLQIINNPVNHNESRGSAEIKEGKDFEFQQNARQLITLELYALINPLIFWLDYSIERPDRLPLFKIVWRTLTKLLNQLPQKKLDIDPVKIILPVLHRVNTFCQTSSPPLEMLQFLLLVLTDFKQSLNGTLKSKSRRNHLTEFLNTFLVTIAKCVPHHLNEEIFSLCESIFQLLLSQTSHTHQSQQHQQHIECMIEALTDKYTMRSKAHKRLTKYVLSRVVIEESIGQIEREKERCEKMGKKKGESQKRSLGVENQGLNRSNIENHQMEQRRHNDIQQHAHAQLQESNIHYHNTVGYMSGGSGSGSAVATHQQLHHHQHHSHQRTSRNNNNDLGLVVNHDDVELSRDFQNHQQQQAVNNYDFEDVESSNNQEENQFMMENEGALNSNADDLGDYEDEEDDNSGGMQQNMMMHGVAGGMGPGAAAAHIGMQMNSDFEGNVNAAIGQVPGVIDTSSQDIDDNTEVVDYRGTYSQQIPASSYSPNQVVQYISQPPFISNQQTISNLNDYRQEPLNNNEICPSEELQEQEEEQIVGAEVKTNFDIFIELCLLKLENPLLKKDIVIDKQRDAINQEKFIEKLGLFLQMLKLLNQDHVSLYHKLLRQGQSLLDTLTNIFISSDMGELMQTSQTAVEIVELLSKFYMLYCVPKNVYEHQQATLIRVRELILTGQSEQQVQSHAHGQQQYHLNSGQQQPINNNQHSQSSGHQQQQLQLQQHQRVHQQVLYSQNQAAFFSSSHPVLFHHANQSNLPHPLAQQQNLMRSTVQSQQHLPLLNHVTNIQPVMHRHIGSNPSQNGILHHGIGHNHPLMDDEPFIIGTDIDNLNAEVFEEENSFCDEVDIINADRLILIKIHISLIKLAIDTFQKKPQGSGDVHLQFHALNLMDNLFANLLPVPSLMNVFMKHYSTTTTNTQLLQLQPLQNNFIAGPSRQRLLSSSVHSVTSDQMNQHNPQGSSQLNRENRMGGLNNTSQFSHLGGENFALSQTINQFYYDLERQVVINERAIGSQNNHRSASNTGSRYNNGNGVQSPLIEGQNQGINQQTNLPQEFECTDQAYLEGRLQLCLKFWKFLEDAITKCSWSTIRSVCFGVICQSLRGVSLLRNKSIESSKLLNKLKSLVLPLVNTLLNSKESESKAGGLNILGSICGLGLDFGLSQYSRHFKLQDCLQLFRQQDSSDLQQAYNLNGCRLIQVSLWQRLFQLSDEDWDPTIRDAASLLIQICGPRKQIVQFLTIAKEKYDTKLQQMINSFQIKRASESVLNRAVNRNPKENDQPDKSDEDDSNNSSRSEKSNSSEEKKGSAADDEEIQIKRYFFIDRYSEDQLREILAIFKNDYKPPPKNLWVEKNGTTENDNQADINDYANLKDIFEDRIVDRLNSLYQQKQGASQDSLADQVQTISNVYDQFFHSQKLSSKQKKQSSSEVNGESEYLIFERHFDDKKAQEEDMHKKNGDADSSSQGATDSVIHDEDLGIIDLDELENQNGANETGKESIAFFDDQFDDDKLPVLKNTYTKKHRPNNSKSVAIGSKTQNMLVMSNPSSAALNNNNNMLNCQTESTPLYILEPVYDSETSQLLSVPQIRSPLDRPESAGRPRKVEQIREQSKEKRCSSLKNLASCSSTQTPQHQAPPAPINLTSPTTTTTIMTTTSEVALLVPNTAATPDKKQQQQQPEFEQDEVLDEYEQRIAQSIASLSSELKYKNQMVMQSTASNAQRRNNQQLGGGFDSVEEFKQQISSNSTASLQDTKKPIISNNPIKSTHHQKRDSTAFSPQGRSSLIKSRTPKEDLVYKRSVEDYQKKLMNSSLESLGTAANNASQNEQQLLLTKSTSFNIDQQQINITLTAPTQKSGTTSQSANMALLKRALGNTNEDTILSKKQIYTAQASKLRGSFNPSTNQGKPIISSGPIKAINTSLGGGNTGVGGGPLVTAITSGLTGSSNRRYTAPQKIASAGQSNMNNRSHLTANNSLKVLVEGNPQASFATVNNQKTTSRKNPATQVKGVGGGFGKHNYNTNVMVPNSISQQTRQQFQSQQQHQQVNQSVSRAKSQSYLNSGGVGQHQLTVGVGSQTPSNQIHHENQTNIVRTASKKKATSFNKSLTHHGGVPKGSSGQRGFSSGGIALQNEIRQHQNDATQLINARSLVFQPSLDQLLQNSPQVNNFVIEDPHNRSHTLGIQILSPKQSHLVTGKRPRPQAGYHLRHTLAPPNNQEDEALNSEDLGIYEADSSSLGVTAGIDQPENPDRANKNQQDNNEEFDDDEMEDLEEFIKQDDDDDSVQ